MNNEETYNTCFGLIMIFDTLIIPSGWSYVSPELIHQTTFPKVMPNLKINWLLGSARPLQ
jgi:hypothetical protein